MLLEIRPSSIDSRKIDTVIASLKKGGIIVIPTDTVYSFACDLYNKKALVRVSSNNAVEIKKVLDAGADGIIVPMVNTVQDAKQAIENSYYPPVGIRGVGLARGQMYGKNFYSYLEKVKEKEIQEKIQIEFGLEPQMELRFQVIFMARIGQYFKLISIVKKYMPTQIHFRLKSIIK